MQRFGWRLAVWILLVTGCFSRGSAHALPIYARQLNLSCTDCHSVWPRLGQDARRFKVGGYVLRGPQGDTKAPYAIALTAAAESSNTGSTGNPTSTVNSFGIFPDFYTGGAFGPKLGAFVDVSEAPDQFNHPQFSPDNIKIAYSLGVEHPASINIFKGNIFAADPYVLGGFDRLPFLSGTFDPLFMSNGFLLAPSDSNNYGLVLHGYMGKENHWYGALGLETGDGVSDSLAGVNRLSQEADKGYADVTYESSIGKGGTWDIAAAYFGGNVNPQLPIGFSPFSYTARIQRLFVAGEIQTPVNDKGDWFEIEAAYSNGQDSNFFEFDPTSGNPPSGPLTQGITGGYIESDYFWRRKLGILASYDASSIGPTTFHTVGIGFAWLPQIDSKFEISAALQKGSDGSTNNLFGLYFEKYLYKPLPSDADVIEAHPSPPAPVVPAPSSSPAP